MTSALHYTKSQPWFNDVAKSETEFTVPYPLEQVWVMGTLKMDSRRETIKCWTNLYTLQTHTHVDAGPCGLHCGLLVHAWVQPWGYQPLIPLQT